MGMTKKNFQNSMKFGTQVKLTMVIPKIGVSLPYSSAAILKIDFEKMQARYTKKNFDCIFEHDKVTL